VTPALRLLPFVALFAACVDPGEPAPESRTAAIINGQDENGYEGTLYLYNLGGVACTGTLISDHVVLTAKHCVLDMPEDGWFAAVGPQGEQGQYEVASISTTDGRDLEGVDIALMTLRDAPGVAPVRIARDFGAYSAGDTLTLVGYGATEDGTAGRKRRTVGDIYSIGPDGQNGVWDNEFLVYGDSSGAGHGDSGGPVFDAGGTQVGVMVRANLYDVTICTRIDRFLDLVDAAVAADGGGGEVEPPPPDPSGMGDACSGASACETGLCDDGVCTTSCDLVRGASCPTGWYCDARGSCGDGVCMQGEPGSGRVGATCTTDVECATRLCADDGSGGRCATPCDPAANDVCGAGTACVATLGGCGACLATGGEGGGSGGGFGTGCGSAADCRSGWCFEPGAQGVCTAPCGVDGSCPGGFECDGTMCAPAGGALGDTCLSRSDCASGMCGHSGGDVEGLCTMSCTDDATCGPGYACVPTQQGAGACWPSTGGGGGLDGARPGLTSTGCRAAGPTVRGAAPALATFLFVLVALLRRRV